MHILVATSDLQLGRQIQRALERVSLPCEAIALNWAALLERAAHPALLIVDYSMLRNGGEGRADLGLRRLSVCCAQAQVLVLRPGTDAPPHALRPAPRVALVEKEDLAAVCRDRALRAGARAC